MYVCMCVGVCIFICVCDCSSVSWYVFVSMIRCLYLCGSMVFFVSMYVSVPACPMSFNQNRVLIAWLV